MCPLSTHLGTKHHPFVTPVRRTLTKLITHSNKTSLSSHLDIHDASSLILMMPRNPRNGPTGRRGQTSTCSPRTRATTHWHVPRLAGGDGRDRHLRIRIRSSSAAPPGSCSAAILGANPRWCQRPSVDLDVKLDGPSFTAWVLACGAAGAVKWDKTHKEKTSRKQLDYIDTSIRVLKCTPKQKLQDLQMLICSLKLRLREKLAYSQVSH